MHRGDPECLGDVEEPTMTKFITGNAIKIENMFSKLKDWRRIATRYDRCAHTFFSALCIAAVVIFYLKE